ncbi:MAG: hypothetical protein NTV66_07565 [Methylococcales bacterium]|nr:hypothetical protein [Methylococcales bacterium]
MMNLKQYILPLIWMAVFVILVSIRLGDAYSSTFFHTVLESSSKNNKPSKEIVADFYMMQPLNWTLLDNEVFRHDAKSPVCLKMFLANYGDRKNNGTFALTLGVDAQKHRVVVDAKTVRDNTNHRICFEDLKFVDIAFKPVEIVLEGINSQKGAAISAWMTQDVRQGKVVYKDGTVLERSLIFSVETIRVSNDKFIHSIILSLICCLSCALVFFASTCTPINSNSKKNFIQRDNT